MADYETIVKTMPRSAILRLIKETTRLNVYRAAAEELYRQDTQRLTKHWFQILTGRHYDRTRSVPSDRI